MPDDSNVRGAGDALVELAERVGRLCREHARNGQLLGLLEAAGREDLMETVTGLLAAPEHAPDLMSRTLDAVERVLAEQGVHGLTRPNREWARLPGVTARTEPVVVHVCPANRCTRAEQAPAHCSLTNQALEPVTLSP
ncbi:hypothetical protein ACH4SP_04335 [Streptomyces sp. NPDC021093]|uniref:hypothetical protein n=1 Tax=Streptomyces sp. NPDC021093 TaxID=3365112 RepID=UPI0037A3CB94